MIMISNKMMFLCSIIVVTLATQSNALEFLHPDRDARFVSSGDSDSTVLEPGDSLYDALRALQSNSSLVLSPGHYQLEQYILVSNLSNVCISGQEDVVISCNENVGLVFMNMTGLVIEGVRIEGCGLSGMNLDHALSEIRQFIDLFLVVYSQMRVALLLAHCENLQMSRIELHNNIGFGIVGVNIIGTSVISQLNAVNNSQPSNCQIAEDSILYTVLQDPRRYGGGAVFIYHDYLSEMLNTQVPISNKLTMEKGEFKNNTECSYNAAAYLDYLETEYYRNLGYRIGGGGGLTLIMAQLEYGMKIETKDMLFLQNRAFVGSGAHVALFSGARNTSIEFVNCTFLSNGIPLNLLSTLRIVYGAGLAIIMDFSQPRNNQFTTPQNLNTSIRIENSQFLRNICPSGGGLYFNSEYKSNVKDEVRLVVQNSIFRENVAFTGPAIYVSERKDHAAHIGTQLEIAGSNISENIITSTDLNGAQSVLQNSGVVQVRNMNVTLRDSSIARNSGTGITAISSYVAIDGKVIFSENTGVRGGAMFLFTFTWLIVLPNASLYLLNNTARESGGAIYSNHAGYNAVAGLSSMPIDCFLAFNFENLGTCINCSNFNESGSFIKFEGNSAPSGGQISGSSLQTCSWARELRRFSSQLSTISLIAELFPTVFSFDNITISPEYFRTQAGRLRAVGPNSTTEFNVLPGQRFLLNCTARDNFRQIISNVVSSFIQTNFSEPIPDEISRIESNNLALLRDNQPTELSMSVTGEEGRNLSVIIYSTDAIGLARTIINVNLGQCGLGYVFNNKTLSCECLPELGKLGVTCHEDSLQLVKDQASVWIGPVDSSGLLGAINCPLQYCDDSVTTIPLVQGVPDFDAQCHPSLYRTGVACGDCQEGRSHVLGTSACLECSPLNGLIFLLFFALGVILIIFIYLLNVTISTGLINGAIFFSNMVTLYGTFLFPVSSSLTNFLGSVSFLSLNFGFEICLYDGMDPVARVWWQLSFPLYLFALIILIIVIAKIRVSRGVQNPKLSFIRAITTLLVLCYVSVLQVAAQLFGFITIQTVTGENILSWIIQPSILAHNTPTAGFIILIIIMVFLTLFYLVPFPFFLLFPKLNFKSKHLRKIVPIFDSFWNPFEPEYRWWLGFRLLFRWVPFILSYAVSAPINIFVTNMMLLALLFLQLVLKPFKDFWINVVDSMFIALLLIMFTGTLFITALGKQKDDPDQGVLYINLFSSIVALLLIIGLFVYHFVIRFSKVEAAVVYYWHKISCKEKGTPSDEKLDSSSVRTNEKKLTFTEIVAIELREPMLDDSAYSTGTNL